MNSHISKQIVTMHVGLLQQNSSDHDFAVIARNCAHAGMARTTTQVELYLV